MFISNGQLDGLEGLARLLDAGNVYVEQRDRQGNWQTLFLFIESLYLIVVR